MIECLGLPISPRCASDSITHCGSIALNAVRDDFTRSPTATFAITRAINGIDRPSLVGHEQPMVMARHDNEREQFVPLVCKNVGTHSEQSQLGAHRKGALQGCVHQATDRPARTAVCVSGVPTRHQSSVWVLVSPRAALETRVFALLRPQKYSLPNTR